ncbi:MAG: dual specificity protein phosphatase family protein [Verrucomicrobia bacterium]|nr:dual specificity protein phosphatase family protein [Verrucomicrobiota bacterium]
MAILIHQDLREIPVSPLTEAATDHKQTDPSLSLAPLWEMDDETYKKEFPSLNLPLGVSINSALATVGSSKDSFGINTAFKVSTLWPAQVKKLLRIAALFLSSHPTDPRLAEKAAFEILSASPKVWDVSEEEIIIIRHLLLNRGLYAQYFQQEGGISFTQLKEALTDSFTAFRQENKSPKMDEWDFRKLLFSLFLAEAGAKPYFNREKAHFFKPVHQDFATMDFEKMGEIYRIKDALSKEARYLPNFSVIGPALYRCGQPYEEGLELLERLDIQAIISFRSENPLNETAQEMGFKVFSIPLDAGNPDSFTDDVILKFIQTALEPENLPAVIYCTHGADRTGFMSAAYRYIVEEISLDEAIQELKRFQSPESEFLHPPLIERLKSLDVQKLKTSLKR